MLVERDMDRETHLMVLENLPLDLGVLGVVTETTPIIPGVYDAILENLETGVAEEAFIVLRNAPEIPAAAKRYGRSAPNHPEFLVYSEDETGNPRYIISYELFRYKILHHLPLPENETIRSLAAIGAEMYPEYFGSYPIPFLTPWGCTTRNKVIANGLFWLETEQCQRGLAVAFPKYDDLSDGAKGLSEQIGDGSLHTNGQTPGYLFFREVNSSVPLLELISVLPDHRLSCKIDRAALMNAVYQFHPEYAAQHNLAEQAGLNDGLGLFLHTQGINVELKCSPDRIISLTNQTGTEFIDF